MVNIISPFSRTKYAWLFHFGICMRFLGLHHSSDTLAFLDTGFLTLIIYEINSKKYDLI